MLAHFPTQFSFLPNGQPIGYAARPRPEQETKTAVSDEKDSDTQPIDRELLAMLLATQPATVKTY